MLKTICFSLIRTISPSHSIQLPSLIEFFFYQHGNMRLFILGDLEHFHFLRSIKLKQHVDPFIQSFTKNTLIYPDAEFTAKPERNTWRLCPVSQSLFVSFQRRYRAVTADVENISTALSRQKSCCLFPSCKPLRNSSQLL